LPFFYIAVLIDYSCNTESGLTTPFLIGTRQKAPRQKAEGKKTSVEKELIGADVV